MNTLFTLEILKDLVVSRMTDVFRNEVSPPTYVEVLRYSLDEILDDRVVLIYNLWESEGDELRDFAFGVEPEPSSAFPRHLAMEEYIKDAITEWLSSKIDPYEIFDDAFSGRSHFTVRITNESVQIVQAKTREYGHDEYLQEADTF